MARDPAAPMGHHMRPIRPHRNHLVCLATCCGASEIFLMLFYGLIQLSDVQKPEKPSDRLRNSLLTYSRKNIAIEKLVGGRGTTAETDTD